MCAVVPAAMVQVRGCGFPHQSRHRPHPATRDAHRRGEAFETSGIGRIGRGFGHVPCGHPSRAHSLQPPRSPAGGEDPIIPSYMLLVSQTSRFSICCLQQHSTKLTLSAASGVELAFLRCLAFHWSNACNLRAEGSACAWLAAMASFVAGEYAASSLFFSLACSAGSLLVVFACAQDAGRCVYCVLSEDFNRGILDSGMLSSRGPSSRGRGVCISSQRFRITTIRVLAFIVTCMVH